MILFELWFDLTVKVSLELYYLPYKIIGGSS